MNRSYRILPCYTGDVSGAASAVYELGGMVVIHDPSGCNSTYNTHDETRWYDKDSLIFISGLSQREAIFGDDEKFIDDIVDAAGKLKPEFVAITSSPIPFMNGTDFNAIAKIVQDRTGIFTFHVQTNGMHDYLVGAGNAFEAVAKHLTPAGKDIEQRKNERIKINILGLTPLDFTSSAASTVREKLADAGFEIVASWSYGCTLSDIKRSCLADVNLVVSATGYKAALTLREKYGTPYVCGCPTDTFENTIYDMINETAVDKKDRIAYREPAKADTDGVGGLEEESVTKNAEVILIGEPVIMSSMARTLEQKYHVVTKVACPLELKRTDAEVVLRDSDVLCDGEEELETAIKGASFVIADPMYAHILPEGAKLLGLPHLAFSGREFVWQKEYIKDIFNVFEDGEMELFLKGDGYYSTQDHRGSGVTPGQKGGEK